MGRAHSHLSAPFLAEKSPNPSLLRLCGSLAQLACVEPARLHAWLTRMSTSPPKESDQLEVVQENRQLLQLLTTYIVRENRCGPTPPEPPGTAATVGGAKNAPLALHAASYLLVPTPAKSAREPAPSF